MTTSDDTGASHADEKMTTPDDSGPLMYVETMSVFLNQWFTTYEDARTLREAEGGYLLPFKTQFFVTVAGGITELGLDPQDPDWKRIGWDWVRPLDWDAWELLRDKRRKALTAAAAAAATPAP
jgi:hypothetical protein